MHPDLVEEEAIKVLGRIIASEKASGELRKQAGKLLKVIEMFSIRNTIVAILIVVGVMLYLALCEEYIMSFAVLAFFIIACFVCVVITWYECAKLKTAFSKQAISSSD